MILGSALDILEAGQPPRVTFLDYPLGHSGGRPFDPENQFSVVRSAIGNLQTMQTPEIRHLPFTWPEGWAAEQARSQGGDSRSPRDTTPRYQKEEDRRLVEAGG